MTYKTTVNMTIERDGKDIEVEVVGNYYPGRPAKTNCRNDDASPAEPSEAEIIGVNIPGAIANIELTDSEYDTAVELIISKMEDDCFEDYDDAN